jgi:hypothetical protein
MKNRLIITLILFFLTGVSFSQVVKVKEGINVLGMTDSNAKTWAKSKGYIMEPPEVSDMLNFRKLTSLGDQALTIAIKDHKVNVISWEEHAMYASRIMADVQLAGFVMGDAKTTRILPFKNKEKNLVLSLITKDATNQVVIMIGRATN